MKPYVCWQGSMVGLRSCSRQIGHVSRSVSDCERKRLLGTFRLSTWSDCIGSSDVLERRNMFLRRIDAVSRSLLAIFGLLWPTWVSIEQRISLLLVSAVHVHVSWFFVILSASSFFQTFTPNKDEIKIMKNDTASLCWGQPHQNRANSWKKVSVQPSLFCLSYHHCVAPVNPYLAYFAVDKWLGQMERAIISLL